MPPRQFACPQCHASMRTGPTVEAGMSVRCPSCGSTVRVPGDEFTGSPPAAPPRPAGEFTDAPRYREDERDEFDKPDGPPEGPGLEGLSNEYSIDLGEWFRYAQAHWGAVVGPMIGYLFILMVIAMAASCFAGMLAGFLQVAMTAGGPPGQGTGSLVSQLFSQLFQQALQLFVMTPLQAGFTVVALAQLKGRRWSFGDFFGGFRWYGAIVVSTLILMLIQWACLLPGGTLAGVAFVNQVAHLPRNPAANPAFNPGPGAGPNAPPDLSQIRPDDPLLIAGAVLFLIGLIVLIYLAVRCGLFALPLIIDRGCGGVDAIRGSWMLTRGHFWMLLAVVLLTVVINMLGVMACLVGLLFTFPLTLLLMTAGYLLIAGTRPPVGAPVAGEGDYAGEED
jgi:hypothetical protein